MSIPSIPDARRVAARESRLQTLAWYTYVGGMGAMGLSMLPLSQDLLSPWSTIVVGVLTLASTAVLTLRMSAKNQAATDAEISSLAPLLGEVAETKALFSTLHHEQEGVILRGQLAELTKMAREHIARQRKQELLTSARG